MDLLFNRKRKTSPSDTDEDQNVKRPLIEEQDENESTDTSVKMEEATPIKMEEVTTIDTSIKMEEVTTVETPIKEENKEVTPVEQKPVTSNNINNENQSSTGTEKVETLVPFKRLVVLHVEVTCDENPTNPAAVQVTKVLLFFIIYNY